MRKWSCFFSLNRLILHRRWTFIESNSTTLCHYASDFVSWIPFPNSHRSRPTRSVLSSSAPTEDDVLLTFNRHRIRWPTYAFIGFLAKTIQHEFETFSFFISLVLRVRTSQLIQSFHFAKLSTLDSSRTSRRIAVAKFGVRINTEYFSTIRPFRNGPSITWFYCGPSTTWNFSGPSTTWFYSGPPAMWIYGGPSTTYFHIGTNKVATYDCLIIAILWLIRLSMLLWDLLECSLNLDTLSSS